MLKTTFRCVAGVALLSGCLNAWAADMKFGYVNAERVYSESKAAQRIETTLRQEFGEQQKQLNDLKQRGAVLQQRLATNLSGRERAKIEQQFQQFVGEYRVASARFVEEYNLRRGEEFAALQRNANNVIQSIAEKEKYDLIVQEAVYVRAPYDITDRVIQLLDKD